MRPRYDDALPILVRVARSVGIDLAARGTVVVRDASGRLGIAFERTPERGDFAERLRDALGPYALSEPVLPSLLFEAIAQTDPRIVVLPVDENQVSIFLADRRVVGMDWLADFAAPADGPPRLVFGSLKGGVGRSTALAVLAADLAEHGRRVLCIDLDLEAPGIGSMLLRDIPGDDRRPKYGALDYLVENGMGGIEDEELFDHIGVSPFASGSLHVLPAVGRVTDENPGNMVGKLARGLTEDVGPQGRRSLAVQIREMVDRFTTHGQYDAVLIDARAGLAETTASTWLGVGACKLVLFGVDQRQTFQGYRYVLSHLVQTLGVPATDEGDDWRTRISFVQSKAPNLSSRREPFRENLHKLCCETIYDVDEGSAEPLFNFAYSESGPDVPHDAAHVEYHPTYEVFDPLSDGSLLEPDAYRGPFGAFLDRGWELLGFERTI